MNQDAVDDWYALRREELAAEESCVRRIIEQMEMAGVGPQDSWQEALQKADIHRYIDTTGFRRYNHRFWGRALEVVHELRLGQMKGENTDAGA